VRGGEQERTLGVTRATELLGHLVERARERLELRGSRLGYVLRNEVGADAPARLGHALHGPRERAGEQQGRARGEQRAGEPAQRERLDVRSAREAPRPEQDQGLPGHPARGAVLAVCHAVHRAVLPEQDEILRREVARRPAQRRDEELFVLVGQLPAERAEPQEGRERLAPVLGDQIRLAADVPKRRALGLAARERDRDRKGHADGEHHDHADRREEPGAEGVHAGGLTA
jgi:hypothetical protein